MEVVDGLDVVLGGGGLDEVVDLVVVVGALGRGGDRRGVFVRYLFRLFRSAEADSNAIVACRHPDGTADSHGFLYRTPKAKRATEPRTRPA